MEGAIQQYIDSLEKSGIRSLSTRGETYEVGDWHGDDSVVVVDAVVFEKIKEVVASGHDLVLLGEIYYDCLERKVWISIDFAEPVIGLDPSGAQKRFAELEEEYGKDVVGFGVNRGDLRLNTNDLGIHFFRATSFPFFIKLAFNLTGDKINVRALSRGGSVPYEGTTYK